MYLESFGWRDPNVVLPGGNPGRLHVTFFDFLERSKVSSTIMLNNGEYNSTQMPGCLGLYMGRVSAYLAHYNTVESMKCGKKTFPWPYTRHPSPTSGTTPHCIKRRVALTYQSTLQISGSQKIPRVCRSDVWSLSGHKTDSIKRDVVTRH